LELPVKCCERDTDNDGNCDIHAEPGLDRVTAHALCELAKQSYGRDCTQRFCQGAGDTRRIEFPNELKPTRDPDGDGWWITIRVFVADEETD
jgi:hypothetical protein